MRSAARHVIDASKIRRGDDPASITALRKLGAIVVLDGGGNVKNVDLSDQGDGVEMAFLHLKRLAHLRSLFLSGTPTSDYLLAQHVDFSELIVLDLYRTPITDNGVACLEQAELLEWLNLDGTQMTDAGIHHLFTIANLKWVSLRDTAVTNDAIRCLLDAHPDLTVPRIPD